MSPIFRCVAVFFLVSLPLLADKGKNLYFHRESHTPQAAGPAGPWLTGPLLTPTSQTVAAGYMNIEPYVYFNVFTGAYGNDWNKVSAPNFYNVNFSLPAYFGLTEWMDIQILPQANYNKTQGTSSLVFGDFLFTADFQLLRETPENSLPGLKFYVLETFPTGSYQKLKPERLRTDAGGKGSFQTEVGLVIGRLIHISGVYYANLRLNPFYNYLAPVHIKGFNFYGGSRDTSGRIYPGSQIGYFFGAEFTLSKNWAFAFDSVGFYTTKTHFSGRPGTNPKTGAPNVLSLPPQWQFSFAPAIEYNFSQSVGIIAGSWFTVAGRNSPRFISGVLAINYYGPAPFYHPRNP
ncbi:MAG TPA: hypothetical protein VLF61_04265 [Rhabdochlamydiaceae bacterium]|nr:hypothetical protein [Rhabdochlamydiaceae bacterium]